MRSSTNFLFPVLATLLALAVVAMLPEGAAGQKKVCDKCVHPPPSRGEEGPPVGPNCEPLLEGKGHKTCQVEIDTPDRCTLSSPEDEPDCVAVPELDGRAVEVGSPVPTTAIGGAEIPGWRSLVPPAADTPPAVARQACTGAVVHRRYSRASIAELREGLRRVTI